MTYHEDRRRVVVGAATITGESRYSWEGELTSLTKPRAKTWGTFRACVCACVYISLRLLAILREAERRHDRKFRRAPLSTRSSKFSLPVFPALASGRKPSATPYIDRWMHMNDRTTAQISVFAKRNEKSHAPPARAFVKITVKTSTMRSDILTIERKYGYLRVCAFDLLHEIPLIVYVFVASRAS